MLLRSVYPRVCGGAALSQCPLAIGNGLSPRVRGSLWRSALPCGDFGSIPACAGEPGKQRSRLLAVQVYPRVCGGAIAAFVNRESERGLSPRVRGSPNLHAGVFLLARSIPACAGEPPARHSQDACQPVYPRGCGGAPLVPLRPVLFNGLSPRVRGSQRLAEQDEAIARSIPAGAGEPAGWTALTSNKKVYPRGCGGAHYRIGQEYRRAGLSPRVRGGQHPANAQTGISRSIPAGAGEPALTRRCR